MIEKKSKRKWDMMGNNSSWIDSRTFDNMNTIVGFLKKESLNKSKLPVFNYLQISKRTGIHRRQVQFACQKLAFKKEPIVTITAGGYKSNNGYKIAEKVQFIE